MSDDALTAREEDDDSICNPWVQKHQFNIMSSLTKWIETIATHITWIFIWALASVEKRHRSLVQVENRLVCRLLIYTYIRTNTKLLSYDNRFGDDQIALWCRSKIIEYEVNVAPSLIRTNLENVWVDKIYFDGCRFYQWVKSWINNQLSSCSLYQHHWRN